MEYLKLKNIKLPVDLKKLKTDELSELSEEIRSYIIEVTSQTGGHLAASLGTVELGIALHYILNVPEDVLIWDVGHQAYVHKLLTGRFEEFKTLRRFNGISGFPHRDESKYDALTVGHSSTSIAAALGFAKSRDLLKKENKIVAVIGDGALTSGLAFEALNNAKILDTDITVILNDNDMSIAPNVGAMSEYLNKIITNPYYNKIKDEVEGLISKIPTVGKTATKISKKVQESLKNLLVPKIIFEEFGFRYFGPIDGHNLTELLDIIEKVIGYKGPKLIHVKTTKGKGYEIAENNPSTYHGVAPFNIDTGKKINRIDLLSYTEIFGRTITDLAEKNDKIVAITAAMPDGTGLNYFKSKFPERFFDVGIAEDFAVTFTGGLSSDGLKPVVAIYSTFLQRSYDQIFHDICLQEGFAPIIAVDRAGLVGEDGPTHHGTMDLSYLRTIPNLNIMVPRTGEDLVNMLNFAVEFDKPVAIRYPRGVSEFSEMPKYQNVKIELGKGRVIKEGTDILILGVGPILNTFKKIAENSKINFKIIDLMFAKPLDKKLILDTVKDFDKIVTVEENILNGGIGSAILQLLSLNKIKNKDVLNIGFPNEFIPGGSLKKLYEIIKFDETGIKQQLKDFFGIEV